MIPFDLAHLDQYERIVSFSFISGSIQMIFILQNMVNQNIFYHDLNRNMRHIWLNIDILCLNIFILIPSNHHMDVVSVWYWLINFLWLIGSQSTFGPLLGYLGVWKGQNKNVDKGSLWYLIKYASTKKCCPNTHTHTHTHIN